MQRLGRHNRPFYRISAIEKRVRRDGRIIEQLGWYDPLAREAGKQLEINAERVKYWLSVGAQPTDTVRDFFAKHSLIDVKDWEKSRAYDRKKVETKKAAEAAAAAAGENKDVKKGEAKTA
jgi:small subunit ribosomal protein S16